MTITISKPAYFSDHRYSATRRADGTYALLSTVHDAGTVTFDGREYVAHLNGGTRGHVSADGRVTRVVNTVTRRPLKITLGLENLMLQAAKAVESARAAEGSR